MRNSRSFAAVTLCCVLSHASAQSVDSATAKKPDPFTGRYFQKEAQEELRRELAIQAQIEQSKASIASSKAQAAEAEARRREVELKGTLAQTRTAPATTQSATMVPTNSVTTGSANVAPRTSQAATPKSSRVRPPQMPIAITPQVTNAPMPAIAPQSVDIATIKFEGGEKVVLSDRGGFVLSSGPSERAVQINVDTRKPSSPSPAVSQGGATSPVPSAPQNVSMTDASMDALIRR